MFLVISFKGDGILKMFLGISFKANVGAIHNM